MAEMELVEQIKLEEDTLCCLPFEPQYKARRAELTRLVNRHRKLLVETVGSRDGGDGQGATDSGSRTASSARRGNWERGCCASQKSATGEECAEPRVLVVESEPIVALLLRLVLENRGCSVRDVGTRAEAVTESGRWAPDVIVTEFPLTRAATVEYVCELRAVVGRSGVLVIGTGSNMSEVSGVDALFVRPFEAEEVAERVSSLIGNWAEAPSDRCVPETTELGGRREVLCDIWRRLTSIDAHIHRCDAESDATLHRILVLLSSVDDHASHDAFKLEGVSG